MSNDQEDVAAVVRMFNERERAFKVAKKDGDYWRAIATNAEKRIAVLEDELMAARKTVMTKRVAGVQVDWARDIMALEFADATSVFVPRAEVSRCTCESTVMLTDYEATFELVKGRWKLIGMVKHALA